MDAQLGKCLRRAAGVFGCSMALFLLSFGSARADALSGWSTMASYLAAMSQRSPAQTASDLAAVRTAVFETMNFVEGRYVPRFLVRQPAPLAPSSEAAAVGAAHYVLTQLYPERKALLDVAFKGFLLVSRDPEAASRASVWGRHLGGNVYASVRTDRSPDGVDVGIAGKEDADAWNSDLTRFLEAKELEPIERARILALVSMAVRDVYSAADEAKAGSGIAACVSCAIGTAIRVIVEAEFGTEKIAGGGTTNGTPGWLRVRSDAAAALGDRPDKAGEEMGRMIGLQALTYYRPVR